MPYRYCTPDNCHAVAALAAMELGKHVYVQKPLTHDIYEARMLTEAAKRYKVVTQMGNQGASGDGVRLMREWYNAGIIGDATSIKFGLTDRSGLRGWVHLKVRIRFLKNSNGIYGWVTAKEEDYHKEYVPFSWRGFGLWHGCLATWVVT
jgi:predicted dehydrogenase